MPRSANSLLEEPQTAGPGERTVVTVMAVKDDLAAILRDPKQSMELRAAAAGSLSWLAEDAHPYFNDILKLGGSRDRLRAKAFGGARMVARLSDIGKTNSEFTLGFLAKEGIVCESHSLGGETARHVKFWPASGRALQKIRQDAELPTEIPVPEIPSGNDLELF